MTSDGQNSQSSEPSPIRYNPIFSKFVDAGPDQIRGFIAYGIYKLRKREWATEFCQRNGGPPAAVDLDNYHAMWTDGQVNDTRNNADQALAEYAQVVIDEATPEILRKALKGRWWRDVIVSVVASAIYTLILVALLIILTLAGVDLVQILNVLRGSSAAP